MIALVLSAFVLFHGTYFLTPSYSGFVMGAANATNATSCGDEPLEDDQGCCRGEFVYDPDLFVCCGDRYIVPIESDGKCDCCGSFVGLTKVYFPVLHDKDTEVCCLGRVFPKIGGDNNCCGGTPMNTDDEVCCRNRIFKKTDTSARKMRRCANLDPNILTPQPLFE